MEEEQNLLSENLARIQSATDSIRNITGTTGAEIETVAQAVSDLNDDNVAKDQEIIELEEEIERITPKGTIDITQNGVIDVAPYANVNVNVPSSGVILFDNICISSNRPSTSQYDYWIQADLNQPSITTVPNVTITEAFDGLLDSTDIDVTQTASDTYTILRVNSMRTRDYVIDTNYTSFSVKTAVPIYNKLNNYNSNNVNFHIPVSTTAKSLTVQNILPNVYTGDSSRNFCSIGVLPGELDNVIYILYPINNSTGRIVTYDLDTNTYNILGSISVSGYSRKLYPITSNHFIEVEIISNSYDINSIEYDGTGLTKTYINNINLNNDYTNRYNIAIGGAGYPTLFNSRYLCLSNFNDYNYAQGNVPTYFIDTQNNTLITINSNYSTVLNNNISSYTDLVCFQEYSDRFGRCMGTNNNGTVYVCYQLGYTNLEGYVNRTNGCVIATLDFDGSQLSATPFCLINEMPGKGPLWIGDGFSNNLITYVPNTHTLTMLTNRIELVDRSSTSVDYRDLDNTYLFTFILDNTAMLDLHCTVANMNTSISPQVSGIMLPTLRISQTNVDPGYGLCHFYMNAAHTMEGTLALKGMDGMTFAYDNAHEYNLYRVVNGNWTQYCQWGDDDYIDLYG